ncbi:Hypothetical protein A7982_00928 [Minicystis rosea]|nr:Hypothetical protein A7982_00928 [Minicystis rosea]
MYRLIARQAEVRKIEPIGERFRLVTMAGADLEDRAWTPGDMIQIAFAGWEHRAYTPLAFDPRTGTAEFLGYVHGNGIGSAWLASASIGERRFLAGPRAAVNLNALRRPAIFFGDETSFSTAAAMRATPFGLRDVLFVFEVSSTEDSHAVLDRIGVTDDVTLMPREHDDRHLERIEHQVLEAFKAGREAQGIFTGKASSIQRLYKSLRKSGVSSKQITNVAYWAPGRKGFSGIQR